MPEDSIRPELSLETGMPVTLYGLKTCDTTRAARKWLDARGAAHVFRDVREEPLDRATLQRFVRALGWERVLNRASTTFRALGESDKSGLDEAKAIALMLANPPLMKRPLVEADGKLLIGFVPKRWAEAFPS